jgi:murein DD-endopeptidase MepM/ murein hydrolase activator NlpD
MRTLRGSVLSSLGRSRRSGDPGNATTLIDRIGGTDRALPAAVASLVLVASILAVAPASGTPGVAAGDRGAGGAPRIAVGGGLDRSRAGDAGVGSPAGPVTVGGSAEGVVESVDGPPDGRLDPATAVGPGTSAEPTGPFLADGTLLKPVAVDTSVPDGASKLRPYVVRSGDTLTGIAARFGVSMMSIWWANDLASKDRLHVGQALQIPPVTGLVVRVRVGDTLAALSASTGVSADTIVAYNGLTDRNLILGQTLVIPGAQGSGIPEPTPPTTAPGRGGGSGGSGRPASGPASAPSSDGSGGAPGSAVGGRFAWPVPGGYVSQAFGCTGFWAEPPSGNCAHFHGGIDIVAPQGTPILAAAAGTVIFAGWRGNGGGYQVWVDDGNGVYTGYHHMSAVTVAIGESVARGQRIGSVGMTGNATGPHVHFEVWIGPIWAGGYRVDPLAYF